MPPASPRKIIKIIVLHPIRLAYVIAVNMDIGVLINPIITVNMDTGVLINHIIAVKMDTGVLNTN